MEINMGLIGLVLNKFCILSLGGFSLDDALRMQKRYRTILLLVALLVMMIISIYQYSWSLFAYHIQSELGWNLPAVGLTFTILTYASTFIQPFSGWIADLHGPRKVALLAAFLIGIGFILSSSASTPGSLSLFYALGGLGVGILYGVSTAVAIKWFPERRGFATGLVVFGFGAGTAIFNLIIQALLESVGLRTTFLYIGVTMLVVTVPSSLLYKYPTDEWISQLGIDKKRGLKQSTNYKPLDIVKTYQWYLIYFSFSFIVSIVLMFGAQMRMLAQEFNLPQEYFNLLLILFPLGNGLSRIAAGALSDKIGREKIMMIFYIFLGLSILGLVNFGHIPVIFLSIAILAAILGGSPFALYPALIGDYYGSKYATINYGITYTAKAWGGLISGWLSGYLVSQFGSYKLPLIIVALCCLVAAVLSNPKMLKPP